jgi:hypothetical protein
MKELKSCGCDFSQECDECSVPYEYRKCNCGHRADRVDVAGQDHFVCEECGWMWKYDGGTREYLFPFPELQTPKILAQMALKESM